MKHILQIPVPSFWKIALLLLWSAAMLPSTGSAFDDRGAQFIGLTSLKGFTAERGSNPTEVVLTSRIIDAQIAFDELVPSWNAECPDNTYLKLEIRAIYMVYPTKYYCLGQWSSNPAYYPRQSVENQGDDDGEVKTDTLVLRTPAPRFQVRLTLGGEGTIKPNVKFLGFSLVNTRTQPRGLSPNKLTWGRTLDVPERSQMAYTNGNVLCSPATVSMILGYWAGKLRRPELDQDVATVEQAVFDPNWQGTGNWTFNAAYAGSARGMRAYVTRLTDVSEIEDWVAKGVPVGLSLCYNRLRGKGRSPSGHLVVCVGFTEEGDPIINDPGTRTDVRKVFPRRNLVDAWAYSRNAVYLIYPEDIEIPTDRFGHWQSWTSRSRIILE